MKELIAKLCENLDSLKKQEGKAEEFLFIKNDKKEIAMFSVCESFSKLERAQVFAFAKFVRENTNVTQEIANKILKAKLIKFAFLRKLNKEIPDLVEVLRYNEPNKVMLRYQQDKIMEKIAKDSGTLLS